MKQEKVDYDFVVIGGGSAGYAAARTAVDLGLTTAVIDGADELGGLCILRGCMPSKALIESADLALSLRQAAEFGIDAQIGKVDTKIIRDRKRRLIGDFADYRRGQLEDGRFTLVRGMGRFVGSSAESLSIAVKLRGGGEQIIAARTGLIATGSVIQVPELPGLKDAGYWTSDTILDAAEIPSSFIVLGGGAIALEMAHYLDGIGRKVTVLQRNTQLLTGMDADLANVVEHSFLRRGIDVLCGTKLLSVEVSAEGKTVVFERDGKTSRVCAAEVLVALGRRPALGGLGLNEIGIAINDAGQVMASATQQTSAPRVFVAGDVCSPLEVVHLAIQQGETAARNAAKILRGGSASHEMDYRCKLFGVFTQPQVAVVGLSEGEANARSVAYLSATYPFNDHGKSIVMGKTEGFVKLLAQPQTGVILGGAVAGPEATELIHEISVAMHLGATVFQLAAAPHYHPTLSEIWTYPADELAEKVKKRD
ncbi:MAG: FAD-dependent oxidoreductase [Verrucomicrobia bacterium]|nr:FAD-dependent oxidoreductase [Verrucomicrobiota bacterium]